jgi:hypothetical protein
MHTPLRRLSLAVLCALPATALASDPAAPPATFTWVEAHADAGAPTPDGDPAEQARARAELDAARNELRAVTRRIAELSAKIGGSEARRAMAFRYLSNPDRAMIGVVLGSEGDGVELAAVTPGGPAQKAGLRAGDRVVAINGKPVPAGDDAVAAAQALIGTPKAGDRVALTIERDGKRRTLEASAERRASWDWPMLAGVAAPEVEADVHVIVDGQAIGEQVREALAGAGREPGAIERRIELRREKLRELSSDDARLQALGELRRIVVGRGGSFFDLRLAEINADLGRYFGTDSGVLVLAQAGDSLPGVKPGDVLLSIGGERTETPGDVMRALAERADQPGVNVELMRDRRKQVLAVDVPEGSNFDVLFAPPAPPAPPSPAAMPAPPAPPSAPTPRAPSAPAPAAPPAPPAAPSGNAVAL